MKEKEKIILAIETGIGGGSISITDNGRELDFWVGNNSVSKSEDVLPAISEILLKNKIKKNQIDRLIISEKPGSLTGLRIGMAITLGLKNSLQASFSIVSALGSMKILSNVKKVTTAVPGGRDKVAWMDFEDEIGIEYFGTNRTFKEFAADRPERVFIVHQHLVEQLLLLKHKNTINAGKNIASYLGKSYDAYANASDNNYPIRQ